jgi:hypothetical protein
VTVVFAADVVVVVLVVMVVKVVFGAVAVVFVCVW